MFNGSCRGRPPTDPPDTPEVHHRGELTYWLAVDQTGVVPAAWTAFAKARAAHGRSVRSVLKTVGRRLMERSPEGA